MSDELSKLMARERALSGDEASIDACSAYWPIRFVGSSQGPQLDAALERVVRFVAAGYRHRDHLQERLRLVDLDVKLEALVRSGYLQRAVSGTAGETFEVSEPGSLLSSAATRVDRPTLIDGHIDYAIDFDEDASLLQRHALDPSIPIVGMEDFLRSPEVRFLSCVLMLVRNRIGEIRCVRVYYGRERVQGLEDILYDLVLENSPRLAATGLFKRTIREDQNRQPEAPAEVITPPASLPPLNPKLQASLPTRKQIESSPQGPTSLPTSATPKLLPRPAFSVELIRGRAMHEEVLTQALEEAKTRIVIVTPFIRARLANPLFQTQLNACIRRGVNVHVFHGLMNNRPTFPNDSEVDQENDRIQRAYRYIVGVRHRLRFIRLTQHQNIGEHSKILICDDRWAVVSSFNWLSNPETHETGIKTDDSDTIQDLVQFYDHYLASDVRAEGRPVPSPIQEPQSRILRDRDAAISVYGEFNSE